jgi:hypothetical protein
MTIEENKGDETFMSMHEYVTKPQYRSLPDGRPIEGAAMNTEKEWMERLSIFSSSPYLQQMSKAVSDFERFALTIQQHHNLTEAYSITEVMEACKEVCSHLPVPSLQTMNALAGGSDKKLIRDFIRELGKVTKEL